jgi:hypothetical protein
MPLPARQRGIALLTTLFSLMLLTAIALGLMYLGDTETRVNDNYRSSQQAYFAAYAGLQNVRERMTLANVAPHQIVPPAALPGSNASILYVTNPTGAGDVVSPTTGSSSSNAYYDGELCTELTAMGRQCNQANSYMAPVADDSPMTNTGGALSYKWVRVATKVNSSVAPYYNMGSSSATTRATQVCWNGVSEMPVTLLGVPDCSTALGSDPPGWSPVYTLTSMAVTGNGARRMLQMEVANDPPIVTKGAVDSQDHVDLNGALSVNGYDYCSCSCTTDSNGNTTCTSRSGMTCDTSHYAVYAAGTVDNPTPSEDLISGATPPVVQNGAWPWDVDTLVQRFRSAVGTISVMNAPYGWSCPSGNCGTQSGGVFGVPPTFPPSPPASPVGPANMAQQVTFVPGNVQLTGGASGNGVLVVDGNLDIHGGFNFYGLVIVKGVISFTGGGSDRVNVYGGVIAGQQSYVDNTLGGSANINFDFCALPQQNRAQPPRMLSFRDITF